MRHIIIIFLLLSFLSLKAQEKVTLYKGKKARIFPTIEQKDSSGIDPFLVAVRVELLFYISNRISWKGKAGKNLEELFTNSHLNIPADSIAGKVQLDSAQSSDWQYTLYQSQLCEQLMVAGCYEPRHLLVFYGEDNKIFGTIEICVSCSGAWISKGLRSFIVCPERMSTLESMVAQIARENCITVGQSNNTNSTRKI
ncbi:hypothetical protein HCX49_19665 [Sphingobacterium kitahiroshimense]|uniref:hypothetical protein n=1 Tax=Sphingobacterium sp. B16(2022) TaxID=2914044 RepID=UPI00143B0032|nr:hypothetical protein [Sphingobacterium sp. B16(2022)]NJI75428.1 hypothetical protein [Sphingobacterium sp. B16(2022)]